MKKLGWAERKRMINALIEDDTDMIEDNKDLLFAILQYGHKGYENYTDAELIKAYQSI